MDAINAANIPTSANSIVSAASTPASPFSITNSLGAFSPSDVSSASNLLSGASSFMTGLPPLNVSTPQEPISSSGGFTIQGIGSSQGLTFTSLAIIALVGAVAYKMLKGHSYRV